jgi:hypothetical protein
MFGLKEKIQEETGIHVEEGCSVKMEETGALHTAIGGHRYWTLDRRYSISYIERVSPLSDYSDIGLNFDVRYRIE